CHTRSTSNADKETKRTRTRKYPRELIERIQGYDSETGKEARARAPCRRGGRPRGLQLEQLLKRRGARQLGGLQRGGVRRGLLERRVHRRPEEGPEGLRHPEEPRQLVLHHRRQRGLGRRDLRAAGA